MDNWKVPLRPQKEKERKGGGNKEEFDTLFIYFSFTFSSFLHSLLRGKKRTAKKKKKEKKRKKKVNLSEIKREEGDLLYYLLIELVEVLKDQNHNRNGLAVRRDQWKEKPLPLPLVSREAVFFLFLREWGTDITTKPQTLKCQ
eukprot:TRINITY_DN7930_c0_g2_i1.p1 TRINITY_DN7930_c0_g2~~TRINITY_DN7930_c0_g2_i1.p1  ORF type:complete len:143 (-),score=21.51 TRINITY_DN7930_c0_g2_i1:208-636(-)